MLITPGTARGGNTERAGLTGWNAQTYVTYSNATHLLYQHFTCPIAFGQLETLLELALRLRDSPWESSVQSGSRWLPGETR